MEKHKYTPVRLSPVELSALKAFKKGNGNLKLWVNDIPEPLQPVLRQLYRLDLLIKTRRINSHAFYVLSGKGESYLNRPRIRVTSRILPNQFIKKYVYRVYFGEITEAQGFSRVGDGLYTKTISFN